MEFVTRTVRFLASCFGVTCVVNAATAGLPFSAVCPLTIATSCDAGVFATS